MVHDTKKIWYDTLNEARDLIKPINEILIHGYDINSEAVSMAQYHARQAGVSDAVHFQVRDMKELSSRAKYGFVITNPPYGERLGAKKENIILYKQMGEHFERLSTWSFYIINADPDFEKNFGKKANKNRKLYNGGLLCYYYQFFGPKPDKKLI